MSYTPRTDKEACHQLENELGEAFAVVLATFAEKLERENTAYKAALSAIFKILPTLAEFEPVEAALEAAKGATDMLAVISKNAELKTLLDERTKDAKDEAINGLNMQKLFEREAEKNAELKKLVEQMTTALKEVRLYSCSHMQSTTHDTIDAALKAAKEQK